MPHSDEQTTAVDEHGRVTVPKWVREQFNIDASGHIRFRRTENGVVIEPAIDPRRVERATAGVINRPINDLLTEARAAQNGRRPAVDDGSEQATN
ncbi:AbrB/MazE/SpoVT family DNA-binding domain-containing protein [Haloferacaceae archaeon DSL9]